MCLNIDFLRLQLDSRGCIRQRTQGPAEFWGAEMQIPGEEQKEIQVGARDQIVNMAEKIYQTLNVCHWRNLDPRMLNVRLRFKTWL